MTPSQARRKSRLLRIIATPLILLPLLTLLMSFLKATYLATLEFRPIRFVAVQIHRLYNDLIHDTFPLDVWWALAPVPAPQDLPSMSNLHIALLGVVLFIGAIVYGRGRTLAIRLRDAERRRQDREWETHPDD